MSNNIRVIKKLSGYTYCVGYAFSECPDCMYIDYHVESCILNRLLVKIVTKDIKWLEKSVSAFNRRTDCGLTEKELLFVRVFK